MSSTQRCVGLFDHSLEKMETLSIKKYVIVLHCRTCGYTETLKRSQRPLYFFNGIAQQKKRWSHDDNARELLQPMHLDGSVNDDFTEAYGYNPFDDRTKNATPQIQGGNAA